MDQEIYCLYHSRDLDGYTSGAVVKLKYPSATLIGYDYGEPMPDIPANCPIIIIDVSFSMPDMLKLSKLSGGQLTWIDHHASAIKAYNEFMVGKEPFMTAVLEDGVAACEGGWKHFFPGEKMPTAILLLGEYDTWRNQDEKRWNDIILPFQFGMRMICDSPETFPKRFIDGVSDPSYFDVVEQGKTVLLYQAQLNKQQCKRSFEIEFKGLRAICLNGGGFNSDVFKSVYDESKHDLMMPFQYDGKDSWVVSLYTTKAEVDCSTLAKSMGGGGHKKAAGFQVADINTIIKAEFNLPEHFGN